MLLEAKVSDPVCIKLGKESNVILADKKNKENHPLVPGAMFNGEHYGFVLIVDFNGKQQEFVYSTQCKIEAVGMADGILNIFEEGKKFAWKFDEKGNLKHSAFNEFTDEFRSKFDIIVENYNMFANEPTLMNPISIKIAMDPEKSVILKDENIQKDYPLHPGVMLGTEHYGFILKIETEKCTKEVIYPTQNRIDAIGCQESFFVDLKVYEKGKYNPWVFSFDGKLKSESSYNKYSKRDQAFVEENYELNEKASEYCFVLKSKKK